MTVVDESTPARGGPRLDFSKVLVVSRSPINRIVVSRIILSPPLIITAADVARIAEGIDAGLTAAIA